MLLCAAFRPHTAAILGCELGWSFCALQVHRSPGSHFGLWWGLISLVVMRFNKKNARKFAGLAAAARERKRTKQQQHVLNAQQVAAPAAAPAAKAAPHVIDKEAPLRQHQGAFCTANQSPKETRSGAVQAEQMAEAVRGAVEGLQAATRTPAVPPAPATRSPAGANAPAQLYCMIPAGAELGSPADAPELIAEVPTDLGIAVLAAGVGGAILSPLGAVAAAVDAGRVGTAIPRRSKRKQTQRAAA